MSDTAFQLTNAEHIHGLIASFISVSQMSVHCDLTPPTSTFPFVCLCFLSFHQSSISVHLNDAVTLASRVAEATISLRSSRFF